MLSLSLRRAAEALTRRIGRLRYAGAGGRRRLQRTVDAAYREWAGSYDHDAASNAAILLEAPHIPPLMEVEPEHTVLDVGCGTGIHLERLAAAAGFAVGCDRSLPMLRRAASRGASGRLVLADARRDWPIAPGSVHRVLAALLLSHLPELPPLYREASRVLAPGGLLVTDAFFWDVEGFEPARPDLLTRWRRRGKVTYVGHTPLAHIRAANRTGLVLDRVVPLVIEESVREALTPRSHRRNRGRCVALMLRFRKPSEGETA